MEWTGSSPSKRGPLRLTTTDRGEGIPGGPHTRRLPDVAVITDVAEADVTVREDIAGAKVQVHPDGTANLK